MDKFQKYLIERLCSSCGGLLVEFKNNAYGASFWAVSFENNGSRYYIIFSDIDNFDRMTDLSCEYGSLKDIGNEFVIRVIFIRGKIQDMQQYTEGNIILLDKSIRKVVYSNDIISNTSTLLQQFMDEIKDTNEQGKYWVTWSIILVNLAMYVVSSILSRNPFTMDVNVLNTLGAKNNELIMSGQYYRLITCMFLHGSLIHIASNMYSLYCVGYMVEKIYGRIKYTFIYFLSGIISSYVSFLFSDAISIGASGAIFGVLGAVLVFSFRFKNKIGKELFVNIMGVIVLNIFIGMSMTNIDNFAHMGGLISGIIISAILGLKRNKSERL
ncbi:rhomboid family intramembrane serine protease [Clostridium guangxiense]|uniref:rhomboid family intramembrane serine protease n=1 Tax=Clostridium guangxiense TaxID=1662055 RepID=UPI001E650854|nr:rhomboid family intramembrane serine protease [Clostridium guangxiense]MCD2347345.1 rhomboid family intramembrane serine protease [Clostridium guangxiense]